MHQFMSIKKFVFALNKIYKLNNIHSKLLIKRTYKITKKYKIIFLKVNCLTLKSKLNRRIFTLH